jgi:uncharacterized membrane protein
MDYKFFFWIFIGVILSAIPAALIKMYTSENEKNYTYVIISVISYLFLIYVYTIVLSNGNVTIIYTIIKVLSILLIALIDVTMFKSVLTIKKILGLILATISVILLSL